MIALALAFINISTAIAIPTRHIPAKSSLLAEKVLYGGGELRDKITRALREKNIRNKMDDWGVDKNEVEVLISLMSDRELLELQKTFNLTVGQCVEK